MYLAICDDDNILCNNLRTRLKSFSTLYIEIKVDVFNRGEDLIDSFKTCNYDAVFLDLCMKGMTGFQTAKELSINNIRTHLIFLTSNNSCVFDCFEYHPFYFIQKENYNEVLPEVVRKLVSVTEKTGVIILEDNHVNEKIPINIICYIMSENHHMLISTTKYSYETRQSITSIEKELVACDFIRIHKKYLVNLKYIKKVNIFDEKVLLINNIVLEMSRRNKDEVMESFKQYQRRINTI